MAAAGAASVAALVVEGCAEHGGPDLVVVVHARRRPGRGPRGFYVGYAYDLTVDGLPPDQVLAVVLRLWSLLLRARFRLGRQVNYLIRLWVPADPAAPPPTRGRDS